MNDIASHRWSDTGPFGVNVPILKDEINIVFNRSVRNFKLNKDDSIAIAEQFGLIKAERVRIWRKIDSMIRLKKLPDFDDGVRGGLILAANSVLEDD